MRYLYRKSGGSPVALCAEHGKEAVDHLGFTGGSAITGLYCSVCSLSDSLSLRERVLIKVGQIPLSAKVAGEYIHDVYQKLGEIVNQEEEDLLKQIMSNPEIRNKCVDMLLGIYLNGNSTVESGLVVLYHFLFNLTSTGDPDDH